ncbi:PDZ and LIM domain protein Zasp [Galendromus occidentalis]|uniref:PDZ and LIM domain protein Zasp n=1 Tax=Galendromus occidentalis TaxID=34638 RepID=A0AAJ6QRN5_9ACAR|nr:PDZ and LIM domain protein Zasp [Galendromus occidentalis]
MSETTIKLSRGDGTPWGFRLGGGKDFGYPVCIQRANPGSLAEQAGIRTGDQVSRISGRSTEHMSHQDAQNAILNSGNYLDLTIVRGGSLTWAPSVQAVGDITPGSQGPLTRTSLAANKQTHNPIGSSHNTSAKPFSPQIVNKQYNCPAALYSMESLREALEKQSEVLTGGAIGINFMKEDKPLNKDSAVYRMVQEEDKAPKTPGSPCPALSGVDSSPLGSAGLRHVEAPRPPPAPVPSAGSNVTAGGPNVCTECGKLIVGVFCRIKDRDMHAECFRCATCGNSLKNHGYYLVGGKLYCEVHARNASVMLKEPVSPVAGNFSRIPASSYQSEAVLVKCSDEANFNPAPPKWPPQQTFHQSTTSTTTQASSATNSFSSGLEPLGGSKPAPRRGRGMLSQAGGRIPVCATCGAPIRGPFVSAVGKTWCPSHFVCANGTCRRDLIDCGFVEENNHLYCERCFENYMAPTCSKCHQRIKGDCLNAIDRPWHPQCFTCAHCHRPFGNNSFYLEDGLPYCERDWNELFTSKCFGCGFPIEAGDRWVEALSNNYHSTCFKCSVCHKTLEGQSYFGKAGKPYCRLHIR